MAVAKNKKSTTRVKALLIAAVCLLLVVCAIWFFLVQSGTLIISEKPVHSRVEMANLLSTACNQYYFDKGEYPPYLLGNTEHGICRYFKWTGLGSAFSEENDLGVPPPQVDGKGIEFFITSYHNPNEEDELLVSDYIETYPLVFPEQDFGFGGDPSIDGYDVRWRCVSSTPSEEFHPYREFFDRGEKAPPRYYLVGGVGEISDGELTYYYNITPGLWCTYVQRGMSYFGYQRGEWLGEESNSAWLWFYGASHSHELLELDPNIKADKNEFCYECENYNNFHRLAPVRGLDILNAATGELEPDGIPDGICLLVKLKDGEVVETIRATDNGGLNKTRGAGKPKSGDNY